MSSGGGWRVSAQLALMGGGRGRGGIGASTQVTCSGSQGTLCPCSPLMTRVGRSWNSPAVANDPRSSSLMTPWVPGSLAYCCLFPAVVPGRCNRQGPITKSPSEGETGCIFLPLEIFRDHRLLCFDNFNLSPFKESV